MKIIESNNNSSLIISPTNKDELKQNNNKNLSVIKSRAPSSKNRKFNLYPNGVSDWDSSDSESGINDINGNSDEAESYQTHF